ncbi:MAG: hypothetical protein COZ18_14390 [Flexibacter sp. CG_4_10_14_3_um_filter_32_15]|nr:MAG: hypothetical protein COZ18_14390 [Flexibacter sp. CG_4_10_14_3_um_filter_32_15]
MAYSDFTLYDLEEKFGINHERKTLQFDILPFEVSERLKTDLAESTEMPIKSEKARSEWIVVPILKELRRRNDKFFTIYSGDTLVGEKETGLQGECDFILSKDTKSYEISVPIFQIVEAKRNDLDEGIKQCSAQLVGAKKFNERKGTITEKLYGCTTTGDVWQFIEYSDKLYIDDKKYYLSEINELLGIFQSIIDYYKILLK